MQNVKATDVNSKNMDVRGQLRAMKRVLGYMLKDYKFSFFMVMVCILGSALATLRGTLFMQTLIDEYIVPLTQAETPDFSGLASALVSLAIVYAVGILCAYGYNRIMVNVSQGTLRHLRDDLPCPSATLTPIPTAISCPYIQTMWTHSGS